MATIYSNGGNRWNILGFNFTKRDALSSVYKISMIGTYRGLIVFVLLDKSGTSCYHLVTRLMRSTDSQEVVPTSLISSARGKLVVNKLMTTSS